MTRSPEILLLPFLILTAATAFAAGESAPDPYTISNNNTTVIQELLDGGEEETSAWWESMDGIPMLGAIVFRSRSMQSYVRSSIVDPDVSDFPKQELRLEMNGGNLWFGTRLQRDRGEMDMADLRRTAFQIENSSAQLIGGDFRVDLGLGWTVGSTPAFPSSSDPVAPLRKANQNVRPQLSSEEGRGWRGAALSLTPAAGKPTSLFIWGGRARYDARQEESGLVLYSDQGNHSAERLAQLKNVNETNLGSAVQVPIAGIRLEASRMISRFDTPLAVEGQPARFRFGGESFGASGVTLQTGNRRGRFLAAEMSRQDAGAWGGGAVASLPSPGSRLVVSMWRATATFAPLHARPWIATGTDPAGRSGIQVGIQRNLPSGARWTLTGMGEFREAFEGSPENRGASAASTLLLRTGPSASLELRGTLRSQWESGQTVRTVRQLLVHYFIEDFRDRIDVRLQGARGMDGNGWGASISSERRLGRVVAFTTTGTYFATAGSGVSVLVIEPSLPGELPVINLTGRRLRLAFRLRAFLPAGLEAVLRARVEHRFDGIVDVPSSRSWAVSVIWRSPQVIHKGGK
ncbi:MAG: hypothetical protein V2A56_10465 [bacterium]